MNRTTSYSTLPPRSHDEAADSRPWMHMERIPDGETVVMPTQTSAVWLIVHDGATLYAPHLTSVHTILSLRPRARLHAPRLAEGGALIVEQGARLRAPALTQLKALGVEDGATFHAPALTTVSQQLHLGRDAALHAPRLTTVERLRVHARCTLRVPRLTTVNGHRVATGAVARERLRAVASAALAQPNALEMQRWHTCETTHCIAGWAVTLAGAQGKALESSGGVTTAALILLGVPAVSLFFLSNDDARERLRSVLDGGEPAAV